MGSTAEICPHLLSALSAVSATMTPWQVNSSSLWAEGSQWQCDSNMRGSDVNPTSNLSNSTCRNLLAVGFQ